MVLGPARGRLGALGLGPGTCTRAQDGFSGLTSPCPGPNKPLLRAYGAHLFSNRQEMLNGKMFHGIAATIARLGAWIAHPPQALAQGRISPCSGPMVDTFSQPAKPSSSASREACPSATQCVWHTAPYIQKPASSAARAQAATPPPCLLQVTWRWPGPADFT